MSQDADHQADDIIDEEPPAAEEPTAADAPATPEQELRQLLPWVTELRLLPADETSARFACAIRWEKAAEGEPGQVADRIVDHFVARGITVVPMLYAPDDWPAVASAAPAGWTEPEPAGRLREHIRGGEPLGATWRRFLTRLRRSHRALLEHLVANAEGLPAHKVLEIAEAVAGEELALLFAARGQSFCGDASDVARFEELFLPDGRFLREDIRAWLRLSARAAQARHFFGLEGRELRGPAAVASYLRPLLDLNRRFGGYVEDELLTAEERAARRRRLKLKLAAGGVLALILVVVWLIASAPTAAIDDESVITAPGGIQAEYFKGPDFEKSVLERTDERIHIDGTGAPAPRVPRDGYSVRWTGYLHFPESGSHALCTLNDDGARLFLDEQPVVDDWKPHRAKRNCGQVNVAEGWHPLRVEFFDKRHKAVMKLLVGPDEASVDEVPSERLCCREP